MGILRYILSNLVFGGYIEMRIFIPRVPGATTKMELRRFAEELLGQKLILPFTQKPRITSCEILRIADRDGIVEHHGLLTITPDRAGEWLTEQLMGSHLNGKIIVARKYVERQGRPVSIDPEYDRRRGGLHVTKLGYLGREAVA